MELHEVNNTNTNMNYVLQGSEQMSEHAAAVVISGKKYYAVVVAGEKQLENISLVIFSDICTLIFELSAPSERLGAVENEGKFDYDRRIYWQRGFE